MLLIGTNWTRGPKLFGLIGPSRPMDEGRGRACGCASPMLQPLSETSASRPPSCSPIAVGVSVSDCVCLVLGGRVYARACTSMHADAHIQQHLHVRMRRARSAREGRPRPAIPGEPLRGDEPSTRTHTNHRLCPLHSRGHQILPRVYSRIVLGFELPPHSRNPCLLALTGVAAPKKARPRAF